MADSLTFLLAGLRAAAGVSRLLARERVRPPLRHGRPKVDSPVPVSGGPWYLAGLTIGGPVSDFGSHAGIKAAVTPAGRASGKDVLEVAHYSGFTKVGSRIDRSRLRLGGLALARTGIELSPWGWTERAEGPGAGGRVRVEAEAATIATDAFLLVARVTNAGVEPLRLEPALDVLDDPDPVDEAQQPLRLSRGGRWSVDVDARGIARIGYHRRTGPGPLAFDATRFHRAFAASFGPLRAARRRLRFEVALAGQPLEVAPGETETLAIVWGCGAARAETDAALARAEAALAAAGSPEDAMAAVKGEWRRFLGGLPAPADLAPADRRTLEMAATGLRMSAFAERERMPCRGTLPSKVHFNMFACWDLAYQALGLSETDLPLAKDTLTLILEGQGRNGVIHYGVGPDLVPFDPLLEDISQPPTAGWAIREVYERDGARDRDWLRPLHDSLRRWAAWFERARTGGAGGEGLFRWRCALESGWDDTPRLPNPRVPPIRGLGLDLANLSGLTPCSHVAAIDLNAWMVSLYESMAAIARHLDRPGDADDAARRGRALAERIEAILWDPDRESYFDREMEADGRPGAFRAALTPAMAWPLFVGCAREDRAARVIERYLTDPAAFFGDPDDPVSPRFPVPSVAYGDPEYERETSGYYWRGQIWGPNAYAVLVALWRYGYAEAAATLRTRLLRLFGKHEGGLFETYDARTGEVGFGSGSLSGPGEPACFQIGLTTAPAVLIATRAYERTPVRRKA